METILILGAVLVIFAFLIRQAFFKIKLLEKDNRQCREEIDAQHEEILNLKQSSAAELESAKSKQAFLASITHEIRAPLNGVSGMAGLLLKTRLANDQLRYVKTIQESSSNLLDVLNDVLDFSKMEAGQVRFETISFDLKYVLNRVVAVFAAQAESNRIKLTYHIEPNVPLLLCGTPGRLRQVLVNIIGNAVKFTERGEVKIQVSLKNETEREALLYFAVRDTGSGVSEELRHLLFSPFKPAHASGAVAHGGSGLGLSIAKYLVEHMDGTIGVNFPETGGAEFWFTTFFEKQTEVASPIRQASARTDLDGLKTLIVDGDTNTRYALLDQIEPLNMHIFEADSAEQALKLLRTARQEKKTFDFVLVGDPLPDMDALLFAETVKADEEIAQTSLVMMPALTERGQALLAREAGYAAYLPKPVSNSDLFESLLKLANGAPYKLAEDLEPVFITRHMLEETKLETPATAPAQTSLLIVEDNKITQDILKQMVDFLGFTSQSVGNGQEALDALRNQKYDMILMDCQMPELDGYETTKQIRTTSDIFQSIPIVAVTGNSHKEERIKCLDAGMDDYLVKPVDLDELETVLQRWTPKNGKPLSALPLNKKDAPVDLGRLKKISGGTNKDLRKMFDVYLTDLESDLQKLRQAVSTEIPKDVIYYAHSGAGASAVCGVTALVAPLQALETAGKSGDFQSVREIFPKVEEELTRVKNYLHEKLS